MEKPCGTDHAGVVASSVRAGRTIAARRSCLGRRALTGGTFDAVVFCSTVRKVVVRAKVAQMLTEHVVGGARDAGQAGCLASVVLVCAGIARRAPSCVVVVAPAYVASRALRAVGAG